MLDVTTTKPPARCEKTGHELAEDGLPRYAHARAAALAEMGLDADPLGHVSPSLIALYVEDKGQATDSPAAAPAQKKGK